MVSRRSVQAMLGLIWLVDGLLQLKPQMFTKAFIQQVITPTGEGQPQWIAVLVHDGAGLVMPHIVFWNAVFAGVQLILGLALMFNFKPKTAMVLSILWSAIVWVFGEGFGGLLTGDALLFNGAPGAALMYGLVSGAIWPARDGTPSQWNPRGIRFAQVSLGVLFALGCALHFQRAYLTGQGLAQAVALPWAARLISHYGVLLSIVLGLVELAVAYLLIRKVRLRIAVTASILLGLLFWWVGQSFGQVFDPLATDLNSGIMMVVLAICAGPQVFQRDRDGRRKVCGSDSASAA